ncbi:hypothetical protein EVAR_63128_1 [Eumeta japonica]|uniref:Uncharacterized protein n=1 Tax=Eumeta variegata TaxID=151549 RepID=A0A4C1SBV5_EUMVA|nr:hypothetical protein EVAR_63128_1 [Eumeta japonica]
MDIRTISGTGTAIEVESDIGISKWLRTSVCELLHHTDDACALGDQARDREGWTGRNYMSPSYSIDSHRDPDSKACLED